MVAYYFKGFRLSLAPGGKTASTLHPAVSQDKAFLRVLFYLPPQRIQDLAEQVSASYLQSWMTPRVCGRQVSTPTPARTTCSPTRTDRLQAGDKCKTSKCRSEFLSALAWPLQASDSAYFKGKAAVLSHRLARAGSTGGDNIRRPLARPI